MARGEELTFVQKRFLVVRLACFDTPTQAAKAFKEEYDIELARNRVSYYDPTTKGGGGLADDLKQLFAETRERFLADLDNIAIAHKAVRLRSLNRMLEVAESRGQFQVAISVLEAAAKERGDFHTNERKHRLSGPDGAPLPATPPAVVTIIQLPDNGRG